MDKNNKKTSAPKPRTDRGTFDKEKNGERHRWKQNIKDLKYTSTNEEDDGMDIFDDYED